MSDPLQKVERVEGISLALGNFGPIIAGILVALSVGSGTLAKSFWLASSLVTLSAYVVQIVLGNLRSRNLRRFLEGQTRAVERAARELIQHKLPLLAQLDSYKDMSLNNSNLFVSVISFYMFFAAKTESPRPPSQESTPAQTHSVRLEVQPPRLELPALRVKFDPIELHPEPFHLRSDPVRLQSDSVPLRVDAVEGRPGSTRAALDLTSIPSAGQPRTWRTDPSRAGGFTILQINDVYRIEGIEDGTMGGLARVRALRREIEAEGRPVLVLHAGDLLFPSVMSEYFRAEPMIRCLNLLDGDPTGSDPHLIATFGNHEFDKKEPGIFFDRVAQADFRWVSSNVSICDSEDAPAVRLSERFPNVHITLCLDIGGVRVGLFGLTLDFEKHPYVSYVYDDRNARHRIVRDAIDHLRREGAQVIVAVTHQDLSEDRRLARAFPDEIDLIVGGHEHVYHEERLGRTWITKADSDAISVLRHDVQVPPGNRAVVSPRKIDLGRGNTITPDPALDREVQKYVQAMKAAIKIKHGRDPDKPYATTTHELDGTEQAIRNKETALGNFLTDVVRKETKADIALVNAGSIRLSDIIGAGKGITELHLEGIFYYPGTLVTAKLTGEQIVAILNNSVSKSGEGDGRFLQISGFRFEYRKDPTRKPPDSPYFVTPADVRLLSKASRQADFEIRTRARADYSEPLDPAATYSVGTLEFLWGSGYKDGYVLFAAKKEDGGTSPPRDESKPQGIDWRDVTVRELKRLESAGQQVTSDVEGRIALKSEP